MSYKETFYFIAKCLTISLEEKNRDEIEIFLKTTDVDWESVVKVATAHYVFPAIYLNFKRADFLKYLPVELVDYMKNITKLNRDRNTQILKQVNELNSLLLANNITPIFLKGTSNLLAGIYDDIAERMIGDIDLLLSETDLQSAFKILKSDGYSTSKNLLNHFPKHRHYPRLVKEENIAAVEVHKDVIIEKYRNEFNFNIISEDAQLINNFSLLSFENQLSLSIIADQINDYGFELIKFSLRNAYDVFLFSKKVDTKKTILKFNKLKSPLNCFIANCNLVFGEIDSLKFHKTKETDLYMDAFNKSFLKRSKLKFYLKSNMIKFRRRFFIVCNSLFNRKHRMWLLKRIKYSIS